MTIDLSPTPRPTLQRWLRVLDGGPADLRKRLGDFPELERLIDIDISEFCQLPVRLTAEVPTSGLGTYKGCLFGEVGVTWRVDGGEEFGSTSFDLHGVTSYDDQEPEPPSCYLHSLRLARKYRTAGFGAAFVAELAQLCADLGLERIKLEAKEIGSYAWGKQGFVFEDAMSRKRVVREARRRAKKLGITLPDDLRDPELQPIDIARLGGEIDHQAFAAVLGETLARPDRPMTAGQALLLGNPWIGYLDVSEFLGRHRPAEPVGWSDGPARKAS